ncbi:mdm2-binding protein isoform X2 [Denticeps clupeoides]|uniref:mdm2-binding protein isoform X2 n=1 Tax=Denticeps clupeoides TaxID=299321 RepID=UPI0010A375AC|nr:mdm2-binding protein isoform X2 [Denticeps clupeoides]
MDRYAAVLVVNLAPEKGETGADGLLSVKRIYEQVKSVSAVSGVKRTSQFPACSVSGNPAPQKWLFALQAYCGSTQFSSSDWEELWPGPQINDGEDVAPTLLEAYEDALEEQRQQQQEQGGPAEPPGPKELFEEAADGLHQLADKLPPPGKSLLDVLLICLDKEAPDMKVFLPVLGALRHMQAWHSAKITIVTDHTEGWQKEALYLTADTCGGGDIERCIDERELWRGSVLIREKKFVSEVRFSGFCLKSTEMKSSWNSLLSADGDSPRRLPSEVFHYYQPVLDLVQLVTVADLPAFLCSNTEFELCPTSKSVKAQMLLEQLKALRGKVGALFSLSCVVSTMAPPPAAQLTSHKWKEFVAKRPKSLSVPDIEVKGETAYYFLLVRGSDEGTCSARMIHSANQINGAAALATTNSLSPSPSVFDIDAWLRCLPRLRGDQLLRRERRLAEMQTLAIKECLRRRAEAHLPAQMPVNHLRALLSLARDQYLHTLNASLPRGPPSKVIEKENREQARPQCAHCSAWPERGVLHNLEKLRKSQQKSSILAGGSSDSLMGPKDAQRSSTSILLDAKELLKLFTPEGLPSASLQPLQLLRGENSFRLSPDLTPRKVRQLPFRKAASSRYHGIEFCLDEQHALERDRALVRLQSRLIRYETQTTCSRELCPVAMALSPAPSPAVLSDPGSVPDGESLSQADAPRLKRRSRDAEVPSYPHKRLAKSDSSECPGSHGSTSSSSSVGVSGPHSISRNLRQHSGQSQSTSRAQRPHTTPTQESLSHSQKPGPGQSESRSQKHARMLKEVVAKMLKQHGISEEHKAFSACSQRLFEISKFYLKDLKTSRGLHEEMKKAASSNAKQVPSILHTHTHTQRDAKSGRTIPVNGLGTVVT